MILKNSKIACLISWNSPCNGETAGQPLQVLAPFPTMHSRSQLLLGDDSALVADSKFVRSERVLDRCLRVEDDIELFECSVLGFWQDEIEYSSLYSIPEDENDVCFPGRHGKLVSARVELRNRDYQPWRNARTSLTEGPSRQNDEERKCDLKE